MRPGRRGGASTPLPPPPKGPVKGKIPPARQNKCNTNTEGHDVIFIFPLQEGDAFGAEIERQRPREYDGYRCRPERPQTREQTNRQRTPDREFAPGDRKRT